MPRKKSEFHRAIYSQVQNWAFSGSEVIITFVRVEPTLNDENRVSDDPNVIEESVVYLPPRVARQLGEGLIELLDNADREADVPADS